MSTNHEYSLLLQLAKYRARLVHDISFISTVTYSFNLNNFLEFLGKCIVHYVFS